MKNCYKFLLLFILSVDIFASVSSDVSFQDKYAFKVSKEVFSLQDLNNYFFELNNLKCYYPDSLLAKIFKDEMKLENKKFLRYTESFSKLQKMYFIKLIDFSKLLLYSRSHDVKVNSALVKYFYTTARKKKCNLKSFSSSTKFHPKTKELIRLEVFARSRFLPTEKSGNVTPDEYKKAIGSARALIMSITRQIDEEVYW
jgi:hypothetical protein